MKFSRKFIFLSVFFIFITNTLYGVQSRKDYFSKPQVGIWFGALTPVYTTADDVKTSLGGGIFTRFTTSFKLLKFGFETSYQNYDSNGVNNLTVVPVYVNWLYQLPLDLPLKFQIKAGLGGAWISIEPDNKSRWDPMAMTGLEISFPAGRSFNMALRMDYIYVYEGHLENSLHGGHMLNTGISLYMNLNIF